MLDRLRRRTGTGCGRRRHAGDRPQIVLVEPGDDLVGKLLKSDYVFINGLLGTYYGIDGITGEEFRVVPDTITGEGVGIVEAMRGTLTHHYTCDENGLCTSANLIVGTTNNNAPINLSIRDAAKQVITKGTAVSEPLLNMVEMAFRAYDPCFGCATHSLTGQMPLEVTIRNGEGVPLTSVAVAKVKAYQPTNANE